MIDYTLPLDQLPDPLPIEPLRKPFDVTITPPGSKSITCRAYVLAALAQGESRIIRPLRADDTEYLLNALCTLGAEARWVPAEGHDGEDVEDVLIKGVGGRFPRGGNLYMGDGGAPTRFMIACACLAAQPVVIDASPRMRQRPIAEGVEMLRQLGAKIEYVEQEGRLPVRVVPSELTDNKPLRVGKTQSSQTISATLLVGGLLRRGLEIVHVGEETTKSYIQLTIDMCREWEREVTVGQDRDGWPFEKAVEGQWRARRFAVEPDASSAVYWLVAASMNSASRTTIAQIPSSSTQPDAIACRLLTQGRMFNFNQMNASLSTGKAECQVISGTCASNASGLKDTSELVVQGRDRFESFVLPFWNIPDAALGFSMLACVGSNGASKLIGLRTLRVKETDRIAALASELRKVGCTVETGEDWIEITPQQAPSASGSSSLRSSDPASVTIETYNDHRMAMAFAVLGLVRPGISIRNPACVSKSYPRFWKDFAKLYQ